MRRLYKILLAISVVALFVVPMVLVPAVSAQSVTATGAPAASKIYNLYATDGYWMMADGTRLYSYGFVGGERGKPFSYLTAPDSPNPQVLTTVAGGPPDPTPGPVAPAEQQFLGNAQFPAPLIFCKVGDVVEIRLKNLGVSNPVAPNDPHTIHLHGLDVDAANDGVPETSVATIPANGTDPGAGNVVVYMFSPTKPGTYFYHCHQEADIHVTMGMYGMLIVYNKSDQGATKGPGFAGKLFDFDYDRDYIMLLSDTDVLQHMGEAGLTTLDTPGEQNSPTFSLVGDYNPVDFKPQYWFINGLSFPNTVHADLAGTGFNFTEWLQAHPGMDPLIQGSPTARNIMGTRGERILVRMANMGFETQPMHVHGFHYKVLGSDQRVWDWSSANATGKGLEKNTTTIGSGEEYDLLFDMRQQAVASTYPGANSKYNPATPAGTGPGTESKYDTTTNLPKSNTVPLSATILPIPDPFMPPYTYAPGPVVTGILGGAALNVPPTQIFPYHNHDDYKATNNGAYPGGQFTVVKMLP